MSVIQPWSTVTHAAHRASTAFGLYEIRPSKCLVKGCGAGRLVASRTGRERRAVGVSRRIGSISCQVVRDVLI
jgi:hypothetical protein